jgi:hypothetical protein
VLALGLSVAAAGAGFGPAVAHPHHDVAIGREQAMQIARRMIAEMIRLKIIAESWVEASPIAGEQKERDGHVEWVFSYLNLAAEKEEERVLYIFLSDSGEFIAANFSGR